MLGALIAYGIQPGPRLFVDHPDIFWSVIISMYVGNIVLLILNLPLIPYISKLLAVPRTVLLPMILFFSIISVYLVSFNTMDVYVMILVAMGAIALRLANFHSPPPARLYFGRFDGRELTPCIDHYGWRNQLPVGTPNHFSLYRIGDCDTPQPTVWPLDGT